MRIALFGDVGGAIQPFVNSLQELGVSLSPLSFPEDLVIIQTGDLIHKGNGSDTIVAMVDAILRSKFSSQWIQLFGNHEINHLPIGQEFWRCTCDIHTQMSINDWWSRGLAKVGVGFRTNEISTTKPVLFSQKDTLLTHAGLSYPFVRDKLRVDIKREQDPVKNIVETLFSYQLLNNSLLVNSGAMLNGVGTTPWAGPFWAAATHEVYPTWMLPTPDKFSSDYLGGLVPRLTARGKMLYSPVSMPFNQVHGHTTAYDWEGGKTWRSSVPVEFRKQMNAYVDLRATKFQPYENSGTFVGIDPGFDSKVSVARQPYILVEDAELILP